MIVIKQTIIMGLLIVLGAICYKIKIVDKTVNKSLSNLVLMIANPVVIFISYQKEFNIQLLKGLLQSFVMAIVFYVICILLCTVFLKNNDRGNQAIERFSVIYSNCGFMGIPLVHGVYGNDGVFYLTAFVTIFNLLAWTHGVIIMKDDGSKFDIKSLINAIKSPAVISIFLGLLCFLLNVSLPDTLMETLEYVGNLNTPLAMIVAGATIIQTDILKALKNYRIYIVTALKLIIFPILMIFIFKLFNYDTVITGTTVLALSSPSATMCTLFAIKYNKSSNYASEIFAITTILSIVTLPLIMAIFNLVY